MKSVKLIILFTALVDVIGMGIVIPTLPFYVTNLGAGALTVTLLFAAFSFCSFISSPFLGALSDRIGRRPVLIISIASTSLGWFIFAATKSLPFLFLGRIVDGLAAGNISTAQNCLTDIATNDKERTQNLGTIGAIFGIGFIIGPLLGGLLAKFGHSAPFWFVAFLSLLNTILALFFLPETYHKRNVIKKIDLNPLAPLARALKNKSLHGLYITFFLFGCGAVGINSIFGLYLQSSFGYGAFVAGMCMAGVGVIIALNQSVGLKHFWLKFFKEPQLEFILLLSYAVGYFFMSIKIFSLFIFGLIITAFCQSVLRVVMTSQALGSAPSHMKGEVMGVMSSVMSLAMIVGPLIGGAVFEIHDRLPFVVGILYMLGALAIGYFFRTRLQNIPLAEDPASNSLI